MCVRQSKVGIGTGHPDCYGYFRRGNGSNPPAPGFFHSGPSVSSTDSGPIFHPEGCGVTEVTKRTFSGPVGSQWSRGEDTFQCTHDVPTKLTV